MHKEFGLIYDLVFITDKTKLCIGTQGKSKMNDIEDKICQYKASQMLRTNPSLAREYFWTLLVNILFKRKTELINVVK